MHVNVLWGGAHYISYTHTYTTHITPHMYHTHTYHTSGYVEPSLPVSVPARVMCMDNLRGDTIAQQVTLIVVACLLQGGDTLQQPMYQCLFPRSIPASASTPCYM